jgi:DNA-binding NtrC family response regulator
MVLNQTIQTILIIDDTIQVQLFIESALESLGYSCLLAGTGIEGLKIAFLQEPSLVLCDVRLPDMNGLEVMSAIKERLPHIPIIIMTGDNSMDLVLQAMQKGAFDYITKPFLLDTLHQTVHRALASASHEVAARDKGNDELRTSIGEGKRIIGSSPALKDVFKMLGLVCSTPNRTSVLIQGESGTGKELIAQTIHANSTSASEPFVGINCTAIPEQLLEAELFGAEKGAYTGATQRRIGRFEAAGAGTIFLDEIGDLSLALQAKLLRVLQERTFERIGGNETLPVRARFVTATHRTLQEEVRHGRFREDLFYRLNVAVVQLPPLRERREDIAVLAQYFLRKFSGQMNKTITDFSHEALAALNGYAFPGNVRELENIVERAVMLSTGSVIQAQALGLAEDLPAPRGAHEEYKHGDDEHSTKAQSPPLPIVSPSEHSSHSATSPPVITSPSTTEVSILQMAEREASGFLTSALNSTIFSVAREASLAKFERAFVRRLLLLHRGNVSAAAGEAQLSRTHFHELMRRYNVTAQEFRM